MSSKSVIKNHQILLSLTRSHFFYDLSSVFVWLDLATIQDRIMAVSREADSSSCTAKGDAGCSSFIVMIFQKVKMILKDSSPLT